MLGQAWLRLNIIAGGAGIGVNLPHDTYLNLGDQGGANTIVLSDGARLTFTGEDAATVFSSITGSGSVVVDIPTGGISLAGFNTYTGGTIIKHGDVILSGGHAMAPTSPVTVAGGCYLQMSDSETIGPLSGAGMVHVGDYRETTPTSLTIRSSR